MGKLYTIHDELPEDIGDALLEDEKTVGDQHDTDTATVDEEDDK